MELSRMMEAQVQARRIYNALGEVESLSEQIAEALDRNDPVAVKVLLAMREEPILSAHHARDILRQMVESTDDGGRLRALLNGGAAENAEESGLASQIAMNERLLRQVWELDRVLSQKIARDKSIYETK